MAAQPHGNPWATPSQATNPVKNHLGVFTKAVIGRQLQSIRKSYKRKVFLLVLTGFCNNLCPRTLNICFQSLLLGNRSKTNGNEQLTHGISHLTLQLVPLDNPVPKNQKGCGQVVTKLFCGQVGSSISLNGPLLNGLRIGRNILVASHFDNVTEKLSWLPDCNGCKQIIP